MTIEPIKIGEHSVIFDLVRTGHHTIKIVATADTGGKAEGVWTLQAAHDHTDEQVLIDAKEFAQRLATEAAGKSRSKTLLDKFFEPQEPSL